MIVALVSAGAVRGSQVKQVKQVEWTLVSSLSMPVGVEGYSVQLG